MLSYSPRWHFGLAVLLTLPGCAETESATAPQVGVARLPTPALPGSSAPNLAAGPDGGIYLTWIEPVDPATHRLRFAMLEGERWSEPRTIASGSGWFVNWADFPTMTVLGDGRLAAHYLQRPSDAAGETYAYHVRVVQSSDGGQSWSGPVTPHGDATPTEHGFVSLYAATGDSLGVVWLDGRGFDEAFGGTDEMSLRSVSLAADGGLGSERVVDARTCECCQTSVAVTAQGPVVVYRDRTEGEIRDIHLSRLEGSGWSTGRAVHRDGWQIEACPVNGPSVASDGRAGVAVGWFTGAHDSARVYVTFSEDAGGSFGPAVRVDEGRPVGRVDVQVLGDGSALVTWIEGSDDGAEVLLRRVGTEGTRSPPVRVTASSDARSSGFPQMVVSGERAIFAWTDPSQPSQVRTAHAPLAVARP